MKKLLCGILCASAGAALAVVESTVATIEVRAIDSGMTNTIVAIPGLDLTGDTLVISNLVKTTNLAAGDELMAFANGSYKTWELDASGHWAEPTDEVSMSGSGDESQSAGTPASQFEMGVGSGIWLSRKVSGVSSPFYVYALHSDTMTSTVAAGTTALLGNPTTGNSRPTVTGCVANDQIVVPTAGIAKRYTYDGSAWTSWSGLEQSSGLPNIVAGTGFWYISKGSGDVTVSWE